MAPHARSGVRGGDLRMKRTLVGVVTGVVAILAAFAMKELPLRTSFGPQAHGAPAGRPGSEKAPAAD